MKHVDAAFALNSLGAVAVLHGLDVGHIRNRGHFLGHRHRDGPNTLDSGLIPARESDTSIYDILKSWIERRRGNQHDIPAGSNCVVAIHFVFPACSNFER